MTKYVHVSYPTGYAVILNDRGEEEVIERGDPRWEKLGMSRVGETLARSMIETGVRDGTS